jgi:hypothetical protein
MFADLLDRNELHDISLDAIDRTIGSTEPDGSLARSLPP